MGLFRGCARWLDHKKKLHNTPIVLLFFICIAFLNLFHDANNFKPDGLVSYSKNSVLSSNLTELGHSIDVSETAFLNDKHSKGLDSFHEKLENFGRYKIQLRMFEKSPDLVLWVISAAKHFQYRQKARRNWAHSGLYTNFGIKVQVVFCVGLTKDNNVQKLLVNESLTYKDMIQIETLDTYENLTYKSVAGLWWTYKNTPQAKMMFKVDDDCRVMPNKFAEWFLVAQRAYHRTMIGDVMGLRVNRIGKWKISPKSWPFKTYSEKAIQGMGYLITTDLLEDLLMALTHIRWLWIEDAFITGVLRETVVRRGGEIAMVNLGRSYMIDMRRTRNYDSEKAFFYGHIEK